MLAFLCIAVFAGDLTGPTDPLEDAAPSLAEMGSEAERLEREMDTLAYKERWTGVERLFQALLATRTDPSASAWRSAFEAARHRGDATTALYRLERAVSAGDQSDTVRDTIKGFRSNYGRVSLVCDPGSKTTLVMMDLPFSPELRRAVEFAGAEVDRVCEYDGILPAGNYTFANSELTITPGFRSLYVNRRTMDGDRLLKAKERSERKWIKQQAKVARKADDD